MSTILTSLSDPEILTELGHRIRGYRVQQQLTIKTLAARAGLTPLTIQKAERGENFTFRTLLRILRGLGRIDLIEALLPAPAPSPLALLDRGVLAPERKRVRKRQGG